MLKPDVNSASGKQQMEMANHGNDHCSVSAAPALIRESWRERRVDRLATGAALCAVPMSIAVAESFLGIALAARLVMMARHRAEFHPPRVFWYWLVWALLEVVRWLFSPDLRAGTGEIRHLLLVAALFLTLPAIGRASDKLAVWRGICITGTIGSLSVIAIFVARLVSLDGTSAALDPAVYFRNGGLVHHWMIYMTVEILLFGGLLELHASYPMERRWTIPAIAIHGVAICVSLTRTLWLTSLVVLGLHLVWRRSKWIWAIPVVPVLAILVAPGPVQSRMADSLQPQYYSNAERVQMWHVGWRMIQDRPLSGVGPGRVEELYAHYLSPGETVPAYHGHLHNNVLQLAAQYGLVVLGAAIAFLAVLLWDLAHAYRRETDRESRFLCRSSLLGIAGYLAAGMTEYTLGHSLGLILACFVCIAPLIPGRAR